MAKWIVTSACLVFALSTYAAGAGPAAQVAPAVPPAVAISPANPASLQEGIDAAAVAKEKRIVIPAGEYHPAKSSGRYYLHFTGLSNLEIDATGVALLRDDPSLGGIEFSNCTNVTLRGLTLINVTPPFTQGKIVAIDPAWNSYDLRVDGGYPDEFGVPGATGFTGYIFDPHTRQWKAGTSDVYASRAEALGPGLYRLSFDQPQGPPRQAVAVGDLMAFRGAGSTDISIDNCQRMNLTGVTIKSGGGFCVHENNGEGGNHYSFTVTYGPKPANATDEPLIACNADAFHSSSVRQGPTLDNCHFQGMPDDGVAIHGSYSLVTEGGGNTLTVCLRGGAFRAGDPVRLFTRDGSYLDEATVKSVDILNGYKPPKPIENFRFRNIKFFAKLTLDHPLTATEESLVSDPAANGSGYVIRNCTIKDHRARGMLLKADDGLIENNIVDGSTMAGIVLSPEIWWNEAGYSRDVTVRGNTVKHVGYQNVGPGTPQAGAISLRGDAERMDGASNYNPGHRHIIFENNTIENCDGLQMLISHAQDVLIKDNKFINAQQHASDRGVDRGIDPTVLIQIGACKNVRLENNTFLNRGEFGKDLLKVLDPAQVKGIENGVHAGTTAAP